MKLEDIMKELPKKDYRKNHFESLNKNKGMYFEHPCQHCNTHYTGAGMICKQCNQFMGMVKNRKTGIQD